jgi:outer membrane protein assembly factor BamB
MKCANTGYRLLGEHTTGKQASVQLTIPPVEGNPSIKCIDSVDGVILAVGTIAPNETYPDGVTVHAAYSLKDGHQMWVQFRTGADSLNGQQAGFGYTVGPGVYCVQKQETEVIFCYDILNGNKLWVSDPKPDPWGAYYTTIGDNSLLVAYDRLYATAYDGTLRCYDLKTGTNLWNTFIGSSGKETPYGTWPLWGSLLVADGKVYAGTNEHSINQPMYRGERLYCFDAYSGDI